MKHGMKYKCATLALSVCVLPSWAAFVPDKNDMPAGWERFQPNSKTPVTEYDLERAEDGAEVLHASAKSSMLGLVKHEHVDLSKTPILCWRWKVKEAVPGADMTTRHGDDYAARVYVLYDVDVANLSMSDRIKLKLAKSMYAVDIPTAAVNYVWDNQNPVGTIRDNAFTDRTRMWVLESGNSKAGQWQHEARDVGKDFEKAFGGVAPNVVGLAIATDTDNTKTETEAWYGEPSFVASANQCKMTD